MSILLKKRWFLYFLLGLVGFILNCTEAYAQDQMLSKWSVSVLPPSIRINPVTNKIIDRKTSVYPSQQLMPRNLLDSNWIYNGKEVSLHGARGEYVSFQVVLTNHSESTLKNISVDIEPFHNNDSKFNI